MIVKEQIHNYPLCIALEVTSNCNLKCAMCGFGVPHERQHQDMEWDLFKKIVDDAVENQYRVMWLHVFGEPLMWKRLIDGVKYIREAYKNTIFNVGPCIGTNGVLLTKDISKGLIEAGVETIVVGLSSMRKDVFEKIRIGANFEDIINNIHDLLSIANGKISISLQRLKTIWNEDESNEEYIKEFGNYPYLRIEESTVLRYPPNGKKIGFHRMDSCGMRMVHFAILSDGRVPICCLDYDCTVCCGDSNKQTINEIAQGKLFQKYTEKIIQKKVDDIETCHSCLFNN